MEQLEQWLNEDGTSIALKLGLSLLLFILLGIMRNIALGVVNRSSEDVKERYRWRNGIRYTVVILGLLGLGFIWIDEIGSVATFLGLVGAGLVIALKEPMLNIAGFLFILTRKPFDVGDRIQIGQQAGDVIDIRMFQFTINEIRDWVEADQSTGRIIHIPNGKVFTETQTNFNQGFGFLWNEVGIMVTFDSNWEKAKTLMHEIASRHGHFLTDQAKNQLTQASEKYMIFYKKFDPIVYTSIRENGIKLIMRYLCKHQQRRSSEHGIYEEILKVFSQHHDIKWAYPAQRVFLRQDEKPNQDPPGKEE